MTPAQITLVQTTWKRIAADAPRLAESFYDHLFKAAPHLRALFRGDMQAQRRKLIDTLAAIVAHLDQPATVAARVQALGRRHIGYGVKDEHYALVERALIAALRETGGARFSEADEEAWTLAYRAIAEAMSSADVDALMYPD